MNYLTQMFASMRRGLRSRAHMNRFEQARERQGALRPYPTIAAVLEVFDAHSGDNYPLVESLTTALLAEHQARPDGPWSSMLLVVYGPMLTALRRRVRGNTVASDDLDQLVMMSFLQVIAEYPLDRAYDRTAMRLRQRTELKVFGSVEKEQKQALRVEVTDPTDMRRIEDRAWPESKPQRMVGPQNAIDAADAVSLLVEHGAPVLDGQTFDHVTATMICGRPLSRLVAAEHVDALDGDRRRHYQREKRRHSRALGRLRTAMVGVTTPEMEGDGTEDGL